MERVIVHLTLILFFISGTKCADVTTVYQADDPLRVQCIARTNALGLPFEITEGYIEDPPVTLPLQHCLYSKNSNCGWYSKLWLYLPAETSQYGSSNMPKNFSSWHLMEESGYLYSPTFHTNSNKGCISLFYNMGTKNKLSLSVSVDGKTWTRKAVWKGNYSINNETTWEIKRLVFDIEDKDSVKYSIGGFTVKNSPTKISFMIGCNPLEMEQRAAVKLSPGNENFICKVAAHPNSAVESAIKICPKCIHGGKCDAKTGLCECPPGFTGTQCERGCDFNRFGHDCGGMCSRNKEGCRRYKLCTPSLGCVCPSGYFGPNCENSCSERLYGNNCLQRCGQCHAGKQCNRYTGKCFVDCEDGYHSPYCKDLYPYLLTPPSAFNDTSGVLITFDSSPANLAGVGKPTLFRIEFMLEGSDEWDIGEYGTLPEVLSNPVNVTVRGLLPDETYKLRVILMDESGFKFRGSLVPNVTYTMPCKIPDEPIYDIRIVWMKHDSFEVEWSYNPNSTHACKVDFFNVYFEGKTKYFKYTSTNESKLLVKKTKPHRIHSISIQAVTKYGRAAVSKPKYLKTNRKEPIVPFVVPSLTAQHPSPSATELFMSWKPPRNMKGVSHGYRIWYKCLHYMACSFKGCSEPGSNLTTNSTEITIKNLHPNTQYEIRVAAYTIMDGPYTRITALTHSTVPDAAPQASPVPLRTFENGTLEMTWLPVQDCRKLNGFPEAYFYKLYKRDHYKKVIVSTGRVSDPIARFEMLNLDQEYELHVMQVVTGNQYNEKQKLIIGSICYSDYPPVQHLEAEIVSPKEIALSWKYDFIFDEDENQTYIIVYKLLQAYSCYRGNYSAMDYSTIYTNQSHLVVEELIPNSAYFFKVAALSPAGRPGVAIPVKHIMPSAVPDTSPAMATEPVKAVGLTWGMVQWDPPVNCLLLNGNISGYGLYLKRGGNILLKGTTDHSTLSYNFTQLNSSTIYDVEIYVLTQTEEKQIQNNTLKIIIMTQHPAPGRVLDLTVYQQGLNYLGFRYGLPHYVHGNIDLITVQYTNVIGNITEFTTELEKCVPWPDFHCVMLLDLSPKTLYNVTMFVWDSNMKIKGTPETITAVTLENVSDRLPSVNITKKTWKSITLQWKIPQIIDGVLESYMLEIIQIGSQNNEFCCTHYTTDAIAIQNKSAVYSYQINDVRPATLYVIKLRALPAECSDIKTVVVNTLPKPPVLKQAPIVILTSSTTAVVAITPSHKEKDVYVSMYFLAVCTPRKHKCGYIHGKRVGDAIAEQIGSTCYIALELDETTIGNNMNATLGTGEEQNATYGTFINKQLEPATNHSIKLLALSEYKTDYVFATITSLPFTTLNSIMN